ncbi:hypothetical protein HK104_007735, partial [Borealophlyctis nickersoniae]
TQPPKEDRERDTVAESEDGGDTPTRPGTPPADEDASHTQTSIHDLLERYDAVKLEQQEIQQQMQHYTTTTASPQHHPEAKQQQQQQPKLHHPRWFVPPLDLTSTKTDRYRVAKTVDEGVVERGWRYKTEAAAKGVAERAEMLYGILNKELQTLNLAPTGQGPPDLRRLQVYSSIFDMIIQEFKSFGPLLADIKAEYDRTIHALTTASPTHPTDELRFLRTKVQKLLSQNENRMLVKYERKRSKELERALERVK